ncbi:MAG TPA: hypothetical protein VFL84_03400 [Gammaproteobacteria bacterium]|nr:hypothetical protein [Gammaproteobacteria bacterium]
MTNFKSAAKRKRELAKLDKRHAKDQKRALRRAERSAADVGAPAPAVAPVAQPMQREHRLAPRVAPVSKPLTLAEAVERWKNTKVVKPKTR